MVKAAVASMLGPGDVTPLFKFDPASTQKALIALIAHLSSTSKALEGIGDGTGLPSLTVSKNVSRGRLPVSRLPPTSRRGSQGTCIEIFQAGLQASLCQHERKWALF